MDHTFGYPTVSIFDNTTTMAGVAATETTNVFVYGTLKRGFPNYALYLGPAVDLKKATFLGDAITCTPYPLVVGGDRFVPFLLSVPGEGVPIAGEVYAVDASTLEALDILEGISSGYYKRVAIPVRIGSDVVDNCVVYMRIVGQDGDDDPLLQLERVPSYTKDAAQHYLSRTKLPNVAILALIHGLDAPRQLRVQAKLEAGESLPDALRTSLL
ncbi:hypothetical protein B5M09_009324 [Aphanomyces astaci]|uniref:Gamma-glutamylcyclotransferase family protein n=1 Tax=Aphanomyces astaci TaxID=112090 RepID=A0A3R7WC07_APHAT|nr:hypothetical protein B5M09_009324 [Aphanomyces astaci]